MKISSLQNKRKTSFSWLSKLSKFKNPINIAKPTSRGWLIVPLYFLSFAFLAPAHAAFEDGLRAYQTKNYTKAYQEFSRSAEQGDAASQFYLGNMYNTGIGVEKNKEKAHLWYMKSAEQGDPKAQYNLGLMYTQGNGVRPDKREGVVWLERSANKNYAPAQYNLGVMYHQGVYYIADNTKAFAWFKRAADQGHPAAQYNVGMFYLTGLAPNAAGTTGPTAINNPEGIRWLETAARNGDTNALYNLGVLYKEGRSGVKVDRVEAYKWLSIAAERQDTQSQSVAFQLERQMSPEEKTVALQRKRVWMGQNTQK